MKEQTEISQSRDIGEPKYVRCRVCGWKFSVETPFARILTHLDTKHPYEVLPVGQELAEIRRQLGRGEGSIVNK
jgi:hypothetical protein